MSSSTLRLRSSIWRNRNFRRLWLGHTVSLFGSQITAVAFPLIAALTLQATPSQMAILQVFSYAPATVIGLWAGVWVDRIPRRRLMIATDIASAILMLVLPVAVALGFLRIDVLYLVAVLLSGLGVFYGSADEALLPLLLPRDQLTAGQSALATSSAIARIAGPGLAGVLIQALTVPIAVLMDAASFGFSALMGWRIRIVEPVRSDKTTPPHVWREIGEGLRTLWHNYYLRTFQIMTLTFDIFWNALYAVYWLLQAPIRRLRALPEGAE